MIYEPVTEFGKKIASLLRFDDGVRLDIHDYLEEVEPGLKEALEKAERFDNYLESIKDSVPHVSLDDYEVLEDKLEAIRHHWYEEVPPFTMPFLDCQDEVVQKYIDDMTEWGRKLGELLGSYSEFTTNHDREVDE